MTQTLAHFLRSINNNLLQVRQPILHKVLKVFYGLSALVYKSNSNRKSEIITITNFDRNLKLKVNTAGSIGATVFWTGFHEFHELLFLNNFLKPEMVVVDAGANIGIVTLFAAKRVTSGKVIAFEPVPSVYQRLKENIELNQLKNITSVAVGLSDATGTLPIYEIDSHNEGLSTLYPGDLRQLRHTEVPIVPLDETINAYSIQRLDLIKMDIEGGELMALRGMKKVIQHYRPVVMIEINQKAYSSAGYTPHDVYTFFQQLGYTPHEITKSGTLQTTTTEATFANIVFLPA